MGLYSQVGGYDASGCGVQKGLKCKSYSTQRAGMKNRHCENRVFRLGICVAMLLMEVKTEEGCRGEVALLALNFCMLDSHMFLQIDAKQISEWTELAVKSFSLGGKSMLQLNVVIKGGLARCIKSEIVVTSQFVPQVSSGCVC